MAELPRSGIVDTLIGFRTDRHIGVVAALKEHDKADPHPHGYMFKDVPDALDKDFDPDRSIAETLAKMDAHGIQYGMVTIGENLSEEAIRKHPDRFLGGLAVDPNRGMDAVRDIVRYKEELDIKAVTLFPAGLFPQVAINDRLMYPIYAKCIELDLPVFTTVGVPGPRVKLAAQKVELLDEVCYDLPELKIVMRHGAEPWDELAVKLMLKWPNLYFSTSGFSPRYLPKSIIHYANTRGADKMIYAGYYPYGIEMERSFREMGELPFRDHVWPKLFSENARRVLNLPPA